MAEIHPVGDPEALEVENIRDSGNQTENWSQGINA